MRRAGRAWPGPWGKAAAVLASAGRAWSGYRRHRLVLPGGGEWTHRPERSRGSASRVSGAVRASSRGGHLNRAPHLSCSKALICSQMLLILSVIWGLSEN